MAEFYGKDLQFTWNSAAGSIDASEYQRGASFSPAGKIDVNTTGAATYEGRQVGVKDTTVTYQGLWQGGTTGTAATTLENLWQFGESGTIYLAPEGTAVGARLYTIPVISQGVQVNLQYDSLTEVNCSFVGNGTVTYGQNA